MRIKKYVYREEAGTGEGGGAAGGAAGAAGAAGGEGAGGTAAATAAAAAAAAGGDFLSTLGGDLRGNASLKDFKDVDSLANSYVNLKQYMGSAIRIPTGDASDEAKAAFNEKLAGIDGVMLSPNFDDEGQTAEFYQTLGAPENTEGYTFEMPEGSENLQVNDDKVKMFRDMALKEGITKKQFASLMKGVLAADIQAAATAQENITNGQVALKQEWGLAYDQNMNMALAVAKATGAPESVVTAMQSGGSGSDFTKWMHSMAGKFNGEGQNLMDKQNENSLSTPDQIRGKIDDIMGNQKHPYWDNTHPSHAAALKGMIELQRQLNPG